MHCIALYCTVIPCIALYSTVIPCIALYSTVIPCIALYCTVMHNIALVLFHSTALKTPYRLPSDTVSFVGYF